MRVDAFAALPPVPETVTIGGETLGLMPLKVGELPAFARAVQPMVQRLSASPDWLALMADDGEAVIEAVSIASRRPLEWVAGLDLDDAVRLAQAVFEVNADFFVRRLMPAIDAAAARIGQRTRVTPGPTPSSV